MTDRSHCCAGVEVESTLNASEPFDPCLRLLSDQQGCHSGLRFIGGGGRSKFKCACPCKDSFRTWNLRWWGKRTVMLQCQCSVWFFSLCPVLLLLLIPWSCVRGNYKLLSSWLNNSSGQTEEGLAFDKDPLLMLPCLSSHWSTALGVSNIWPAAQKLVSDDLTGPALLGLTDFFHTLTKTNVHHRKQHWSIVSEPHQCLKWTLKADYFGCYRSILP